jgi:copper(I)-binding protein
MRFLTLTLAFLALPTFAQNNHDDHLSTLDGLRVLHAWTPATHDDHALIYMEISNTRDEKVMLEGAETDLATKATLVGFTLVDGKATYQALPAMPIAPGSDLDLEPNALAFKLEGLKDHLHQGDEFELELETSLGHLHVHVAVESEGAHQHSHAGHSH